MNNLLKLSNDTHPDGTVDFIANKTKNNYINLGGANSKNVIDCVHYFMCSNDIWNVTDIVIHTKKPINFVPDARYHNVSFLLNFYNKARLAKEARDKQNSERANAPSTFIAPIPNNNGREEFVANEFYHEHHGYPPQPENLDNQSFTNLHEQMDPQPMIIKQLSNPNMAHKPSAKPPNGTNEQQTKKDKNKEKVVKSRKKPLEEMIDEDSGSMDDIMDIIETKKNKLAKKNKKQTKEQSKDKSTSDDVKNVSDDTQYSRDYSSDDQSISNDVSTNDISSETDGDDLNTEELAEAMIDIHSEDDEESLDDDGDDDGSDGSYSSDVTEDDDNAISIELSDDVDSESEPKAKSKKTPNKTTKPIPKKPAPKTTKASDKTTKKAPPAKKNVTPKNQPAKKTVAKETTKTQPPKKNIPAKKQQSSPSPIPAKKQPAKQTKQTAKAASPKSTLKSNTGTTAKASGKQTARSAYGSKTNKKPQKPNGRKGK